VSFQHFQLSIIISTNCSYFNYCE